MLPELPDDSEQKFQKIEILGNGQQVVCFGQHKDTQQPYRWFGGEPGAIKREGLPYVRQGDMEVFIDAAAELVIKEFDFVPVESKAKANSSKQQTKTEGPAGARERAYAEAALTGCAAELAATKSGSRNETLNAVAYRLGRMVARGWIKRADVEEALLKAMHDNAGVDDDGITAAKATLRSGLGAGEKEPHPDLRDDEEEAPAAQEAPPQHPQRTLDEVHEVFRKWFGKEYDTDVIDAVACTAAAERLAGDPLWLLVISGPAIQRLKACHPCPAPARMSPARFPARARF